MSAEASVYEGKLNGFIRSFDESFEKFFKNFTASCEFLAEIGKIDESFEGFDDDLKDLCQTHAEWQMKFRKAKEFLEIVENCGDPKSLDKLLPLIDACKSSAAQNEEDADDDAADSAKQRSQTTSTQRRKKSSQKGATKKAKSSQTVEAAKNPYYTQLKAKIWVRDVFVACRAKN